MHDVDIVKSFRDRLRIFLILYYFSEPYADENNPHYKRVFQTEVKIQKIDFLIRNPDYLSYELLKVAEDDASKLHIVKKIVKKIFDSREPELMREEMKKFLFGAYEDIDDVIGFLNSFGLIGYSSRKDVSLRTFEKEYYITQKAIDIFDNKKDTFDYLNWYLDRCELIKEYFGDLTGTQLKTRQYDIDEYRKASWSDFIGSVQKEVRTKYKTMFGEAL